MNGEDSHSQHGIRYEDYQMSSTQLPNRRQFTKASVMTGAALAIQPAADLMAEAPRRRIRTGVIGCGSVSNALSPDTDAI